MLSQRLDNSQSCNLENWKTWWLTCQNLKKTWKVKKKWILKTPFASPKNLCLGIFPNLRLESTRQKTFQACCQTMQIGWHWSGLGLGSANEKAAAWKKTEMQDMPSSLPGAGCPLFEQSKINDNDETLVFLCALVMPGRTGHSGYYSKKARAASEASLRGLDEFTKKPIPTCTARTARAPISSI